MNQSLKLSIQKIYPDLRRSEKKVADYLLSHTGSYRNLTLDRIAREAEVSQPTVLRFIRAMGYSGFKEFRYVLAEEKEEKTGTWDHILYGFPFTEYDHVEDVPAKLISTTIEHLKDTLRNISPDTLKEVVQALVRAEKIAVYYVENSACTASDLVTKLLYLGMNCCAYNDYYMQNVSAGNLTEKDVAVGISYSGNSRSTVDAMRTAHENGVKTIAITNFENSLIEKYSDLVLRTSNQQHFYGDAIFSRVSQLAVVDMIYTGIMLSDYEKYTGILDRSSRLIQAQAYPPEE